MTKYRNIYSPTFGTLRTPISKFTEPKMGAISAVMNVCIGHKKNEKEKRCFSKTERRDGGQGGTQSAVGERVVLEWRPDGRYT